MTSRELIDHVSKLKPNPYEQSLETFVESFELRVKRELFLERSPVYNADSLALAPPQDMLYTLFLISVIDYLNGEYGSFTNTSAEFNAQWDRVSREFFERNTHTKRRISLW